jgi:hypothetical protein
MKTTTSQILKACSLSIALLGSAAVVMAISLPDVAYADNGKGNGNGGSKGNSGSNGNAGGNGNGGGKSTEKSSATKSRSADTATAKPSETAAQKASKAKPKPKDGELAGLAHPSELGALNAAHANAKALENAAPNSRLGRIAAYRDIVLAGRVLADELAEKSALLATLPKPRDLAVINDEVAAADAKVAENAEAVALLQKQLDAETDDALRKEIQSQLDDAVGLLTEAETVAGALKQEQAAAVNYAALNEEVAELTQKVEDQPMEERSALEAAANKPVTDEVEAAVKALLGL